MRPPQPTSGYLLGFRVSFPHCTPTLSVFVNRTLISQGPRAQDGWSHISAYQAS